MELVVDLHIHSHYSRATCKDCTLESLYKWGKIKGIDIIGTGDFTHPEWFKEIQEKLVEAEPGLYKLKGELEKNLDKDIPQSCKNNHIRFILTVEISNIYVKKGKVRKVHNLIITPSLETANEINHQLSKIGNLSADGRPILGMDSKDLLQLSLETNPQNLFIPAHIWTPWFGMFGSKSGFDSLEESFNELTPYIYAIETGLSSDPYMNWSVSNLSNITITSHSDAHSPQKLGREATLIKANMSYADIIGAIKTNDERLIGTLEFFPEEGKYYLDGHRGCNTKFTPDETKQLNGICPVCKKKVTLGVQYRVDELATLTNATTSKNNKKVEYIIPLAEIIADIKGIKTTSSKAVTQEYFKVCETFCNEFSLLRSVPIAEISQNGFPQLSGAIEKLRSKEVSISPGYDGVYGTIHI